MNLFVYLWGFDGYTFQLGIRRILQSFATTIMSWVYGTLTLFWSKTQNDCDQSDLESQSKNFVPFDLTKKIKFGNEAYFFSHFNGLKIHASGPLQWIGKSNDYFYIVKFSLPNWNR